LIFLWRTYIFTQSANTEMLNRTPIKWKFSRIQHFPGFLHWKFGKVTPKIRWAMSNRLKRTFIVWSNLKWKDHVNYLTKKIKRSKWKDHVKKIKRSIGLLSKIRYYVNENTLKTLYSTLIYPLISYSLVAWGNNYSSTLKPLFILQKKAIRIMTFSNFDASSSPLFKSLELLKLYIYQT
jgi:hypothetical protein